MRLKPIVCIPFGYPESERELEKKWEAERLERIRDRVMVWNEAFPNDPITVDYVLYGVF